MKIEFLNNSLDEARVTRGLLRRRAAHVIWAERRIPLEYSYKWEHAWLFAGTRRYVGWWTARKLQLARDRMRKRREIASREGKEWVPVNSLPPARVVSR